MSDEIGTQGAQKLDVAVRVFPTEPSQDSKLLANASVTLGGCFAIRGVRIMDSDKGPFVSMPQRRTKDGEYKDICFPTTAELRKEINAAVLGEYQKTVERGPSRAEQGQDKRESVLGQLSEKAAEAKAPTGPKLKPPDRGDR